MAVSTFFSDSDTIIEIVYEQRRFRILKSTLKLLVRHKVSTDGSCFCGSGKPYKKCCRKGPYEYDPYINENFLARDVASAEPRTRCAFPTSSETRCNCSAIIDSHSVQRSSLAKLSDVDREGRYSPKDGNHVLTMHYEVADHPTLFGRPVGTKDAAYRDNVSGSIFYRFCADHDTKAFLSIENNNEFEGKAGQFFACGYRAVCWSDYIIRWQTNQLNVYKRELNRKGVLTCFEIELDLDQDQIGRVLSDYDNAKAQGNFNEIDGVAFEIEGRQSFFAASYGQIPKSLKSKSAHNSGWVGLNVIGSNNSSRFFIVFSWVRGDLAVEAFFRSLAKRSSDQILSTLVQMIFTFTRNIYFSHIWASSLPTAVVDRLRMLSSRPRSYHLIKPTVRIPGLDLVRVIKAPEPTYALNLNATRLPPPDGVSSEISNIPPYRPENETDIADTIYDTVEVLFSICTQEPTPKHIIRFFEYIDEEILLENLHGDLSNKEIFDRINATIFMLYREKNESYHTDDNDFLLVFEEAIFALARLIRRSKLEKAKLLHWWHCCVRRSLLPDRRKHR